MQLLINVNDFVLIDIKKLKTFAFLICCNVMVKFNFIFAAFSLT